MQFQDEKPYIELKQLRGYEKRYVKTGLSDGIQIEVMEGLKKATSSKYRKRWKALRGKGRVGGAR